MRGVVGSGPVRWGGGGVILPVMDAAGRVLPVLFDARVPSPLGVEATSPRVLGAGASAEECPEGRHVWDAIETRGTETYSDDSGKATQPFRLALTCVRCGLVVHRTGVLESTGVTRLIPRPVRAGGLIAQQVWSWGVADLTGGSWAVHRAGDDVRVGGLGADCGPRGRRFYTGRLDAWPDGRSVQAPTVAACLRKLARLDLQDQGDQVTPVSAG